MDVATASPEALVMKLMDRALFHLRVVEKSQSSTEERCNALAKALAIVTELRNVLDLERGGEIANNLDALYEFVIDRLVQANLRGSDQPAVEARRVLEPLAEGWRAMGNQSSGAGATAA